MCLEERGFLDRYLSDGSADEVQSVSLLDIQTSPHRIFMELRRRI
jgi:hypothetical protein